MARIHFSRLGLRKGIGEGIGNARETMGAANAAINAAVNARSVLGYYDDAVLHVDSA